VGDSTIGKAAIFRIICAMRVYVLVLDGVFDLGLSAILDAFQTANELIEMTGFSVPQFEVKIVGMRKTVRTAHGLNVPVQPAGRRTPEYVIVPAIACKTLDTLKVALARPDVRDAAKAFRKWETTEQS
jgi:transcriptional regulator GlxA family with amidase domain